MGRLFINGKEVKGVVSFKFTLDAKEVEGVASEAQGIKAMADRIDEDCEAKDREHDATREKLRETASRYTFSKGGQHPWTKQQWFAMNRERAKDKE